MVYYEIIYQRHDLNIRDKTGKGFSKNPYKVQCKRISVMEFNQTKEQIAPNLLTQDLMGKIFNQR